MNPIFIKEFLPEQILNLCNSYALIKYSNYSEVKIDSQTSSLIAKYGDHLMETLLDMSTPVVEQNVGKKLWPTYSFFRIYDKGSCLPIHKDRPSCEYTVALCLGADPIDKPYEIFVGEEDKTSDYKFFDDDKSYNRYRIDHKFSMLPNNALLFKGMDKIHWREYCQHDHFITVFLHYVDQEGEYKDYKFDKRNSLGASASTKK
jgi:hypothetical protein